MPVQSFSTAVRYEALDKAAPNAAAMTAGMAAQGSPPSKLRASFYMCLSLVASALLLLAPVVYLSATSSAAIPVSPKFIFSWPPLSSSAAGGNASPGFAAGATAEFAGDSEAGEKQEVETMVLGTAPPGQTIVIVSRKKDNNEAANAEVNAGGSTGRSKEPLEGEGAEAEGEAAQEGAVGGGRQPAQHHEGTEGEAETQASLPAAMAQSAAAAADTLPPLLNITDRIPGSRLITKRQVDEFRARWRCISESGRWELDGSPRPLPWALPNYTFGGCDAVFIRHRKTHLAGPDADAAAVAPDAQDRWVVRGSLMYDWTVEERRCGGGLREFESGRMCEVVGGGGKNIAFIGDSLTGQMHTSFFNHMRMAQRNQLANSSSSSSSAQGNTAAAAAVPRPYNELCCGGVLQENPTLGEWQVCEGASFCSAGQETGEQQQQQQVPSRPFIADFIRNDFLTVVDHPRWNLDTFAVELPFLGYMTGNRCDVMRPQDEVDRVNKSKKRNRRQMRERRKRRGSVESAAAASGTVLPPAQALNKKYDILVMNRGAHYAEDDVFVRELCETMLALRTHFPSALIIYRNTPPGHVNCTQHWEPIPERQAPEGLPYNWGDFTRQNEMAREIVEAAGAVYLDVDAMTALRPDGHLGKNRRYKVDCLHYCLPGPIDFWTKMLYNVLLEVL